MDAYGKIENLELFPLLILTFFSPILGSKFSIVCTTLSKSILLNM